MQKYRDTQWEIENSDLYKLLKSRGEDTSRLTLDDVKNFSRESFKKGLTYIDPSVPFIELSETDEFCFIGRVDTNIDKKDNYNPEAYYCSCSKRTFMSFSTLTHKNISHYKNGDKNFMFVYNMPVEAIVHIFPCDSDTRTEDNELITPFPSLWISLERLNSLTEEIATYDQIICKTRDSSGNIIKPAGLLIFNELTEEALSVARAFGIPLILVHTHKKAIAFHGDIQKNELMVDDAHLVLKREFGITEYKNYYVENGFDPY